MNSKVMTMTEAVKTFVRPGDTVFFAGMQHGEPVAAMHEIVRQRIGHLTVVPALTLTLGILIAEGLVDKLKMAFVRDIFERRDAYTIIKARQRNCYPVLEEYSHFGLSLALLAGEMGIPFMATKSHLGSDFERFSDHFRRMKCPFTGEEMMAVRAINPDVGIIHVQRADPYGNAQKWGSLGMDRMGVNASRKIIVTTEEVVDSDVIRRDPNRTIVPGIRVSAVVEAAWGAYPIHLAGCYDSDLGGYLGEVEGKGEVAFEHYMREFVYGVETRGELMRKIGLLKGEDYLEGLKAKKAESAEG